MRKLVIVDVDGTLTDAYGNIHSNVVKMLEKLKNKDFDVILSSGNGYFILVGLAYYLPVNRLVIAENGGVVGFRDNKLVLGDRNKAVKARDIIIRKRGDIIKESWQNKCRIVDLAFRPRIDKMSLDDAYRVIKDVLRDMDDVIVENSGWAIHVRDSEVNKGKGLLKVCEILGYDEHDTIAVGDSITDLSMFKIAGFSIAVGNASSELISIANYVTQKSYGEGFVEAGKYILEKF
ncbi:MAG: phosphoglycolate phosphatase [Thermoproteales archaeon]|nr:phosphoglycolate phosphatase [Thermoproteales archaeon]